MLTILALFIACQGDCPEGFLRDNDGNCVEVFGDCPEGSMRDNSGMCVETNDADADADADSDTDTDTGGPDDTGHPEDMAFTTEWSDYSLTFTITNGNGDFTLGMAETDPAAPDPWTGEDCLNGYTMGDGTVLLYCHPMTISGGTFASGGNPLTLDERSETVFTRGDTGVITYAVWDHTNTCWTWGDDARYYTRVGCIDINW